MQFNFEGDYAAIPELMRGGIQRYVEHGVQPGQFLSAVLCNDLRGAISRADSTNINILHLYVQWFDRYFPALYGKENFLNHVKPRG
jgi:hypothetical protein